MKKKKPLLALLIFVMGFYLAHGLFFAKHHMHDTHPSESIISQIVEVDTPSACGDICDFHFIFHQSFIIPSHISFYHDSPVRDVPSQKAYHYYFTSLVKLNKPPIFTS